MADARSSSISDSTSRENDPRNKTMIHSLSGTKNTMNGVLFAFTNEPIDRWTMIERVSVTTSVHFYSITKQRKTNNESRFSWDKKRGECLEFLGILFDVNGMLSYLNLLFLISSNDVDENKSHTDVRKEKPDEFRPEILRPEWSFGLADIFRTNGCGE